MRMLNKTRQNYSQRNFSLNLKFIYFINRARSRILEHDSIKEREKIVIKFLKIMKVN